jgi:hypothetical protein
MQVSPSLPTIAWRHCNGIIPTTIASQSQALVDGITQRAHNGSGAVAGLASDIDPLFMVPVVWPPDGAGAHGGAV